ncbi:MAG: thioredoxin family protein [Prevotella sp.]|nr:thioredoxin family protein [Prevotella sp.]
MKKIILMLVAVAFCMSAAAQGVNFVEGKTLSEVEAQAKAEGKLVFVDYYTEWCGPCKMMATKEFVKKEAGDYFNAKFVNFKIDMEKGEGPEVGKKYDVAVYPTFLILEANGDLRGRCVGFAEISTFIQKVEEVLSTEKGLPWYQKKFKDGERDEAFLKEYMKILQENYMRDEMKNVATMLLNGKSGAQIAADKNLFGAFQTGGFTPLDDLFLNVYKERATIVEKQGERAIASMDNLWKQYALTCLKFDGKTYKGFDADALEAYKQKMIAYNVPDVDGIIKETLHTKAQYAKEYPTLIKDLQDSFKQGNVNDRLILTDMRTLAEEYKSNKKAMKTVTKLAKQRVAELQKKDTTGEREFDMGGKKLTITSYFIQQYEEVIAETAKK